MKNEKLLLLALTIIFISSVIIAAVLQIGNENQGGFASGASEPVLKLANWDYAWGDPSGFKKAEAQAPVRSAEEWNRAERLSNPGERGEASILWLRTRLPEYLGANPHLLIQASQLFEVYAGGKLIYRHGQLDKPHYIGTPPRLVPLPAEAEGKELAVRVYSSTSKIGLLSIPKINARSELMLELIQKHAVRFILGCFYLLIGLIALYPYSKLKQAYLFSFSCFALSFGMYTIIRTSLIYLVWDNSEFWMVMEFCTLMLSVVFIFSFTKQLFGVGYKGIIDLVWRFHLLFAAATIPLIVAHLLEANDILLVYQVLLLASISLMIGFIARTAIKGDGDAQILLLGMFLFCICGVWDILKQMVAGLSRYPELAYWGVFFFLISLIILIIRRLHSMLFRLTSTEKLSVAGQMAAGVAHEIRNPVTVISGYLQLMRKDPTHQKPMIEMMLSEVNRIQLIVTEFLFLAKPSEPKFVVRPIAPVILDVLRLYGMEASNTNVCMVHRIPEGLPMVSYDENQLKQVLINVVKNSIEAMSVQGGELTVDVAARSGFLAIKITDTGCGIPDKDMSRIGEPFYTTKENGNGLGVMICRRIMENHRGHFTITSYPDVGTSVDILLPLSRK